MGAVSEIDPLTTEASMTEAMFGRRPVADAEQDDHHGRDGLRQITLDLTWCCTFRHPASIASGSCGRPRHGAIGAVMVDTRGGRVPVHRLREPQAALRRRSTVSTGRCTTRSRTSATLTISPSVPIMACDA